MTLARRWEAQLNGLREVLLANEPLEADGSGSFKRLATRAAVRACLPGEVELFDGPRGQCIRLALTGRSAFRSMAESAEAAAFMARVDDEQVASETEPEGEAVWLAGVEPPTQLAWQLEHSLARREELEVERLGRMWLTTLESVRLRTVEVRVPDGTPDPRLLAVSRWRADAATPSAVSPEDIAVDMRAVRTAILVPPDVDEVVRRARLLYVGGWQSWELFSLAAREAVFALEASLRQACAPHGKQATPFAKVIDRAPPDLISEWDRRRMHLLRRARNFATHPDGPPPLQWISWSRSDIVEAVELINRMWIARGGLLPVELSFERGA